MTHDELITAASRYFREEFNATVQLREFNPRPGSGRVEDLIAWSLVQYRSHVVECKTSRADFLADEKKTGEPEVGMSWWFFALPGVARLSDVLMTTRGLIEVAPCTPPIIRKRAPLRLLSTKQAMYERLLLIEALADKQCGDVRQDSTFRQEIDAWCEECSGVIESFGPVVGSQVIRMVGRGPWNNRQRALRELETRIGRSIRGTRTNETPGRYAAAP